MNKALLQIHLAVFLWGFTGVLGKAISLSAPVLVWYRMLLTSLILLLIITIKKEWFRIKIRDLFKLFGIGCLFAIHWICFYASIKLSNASIAMICLATASIFISILDPIVNKYKFKRFEIILSLIALSGVLIIYLLQPNSSNNDSTMLNFEMGIILGIIAAIISAVFTIFNKPLAQKYPVRPLVFIEMVAGLLFITLLGFFYLPLQEQPENLTPIGWDYLWLFLLSYCCTVWGQSLAMSSLKKLSPFTVTFTVNLEPIYGIILAFLIYHENQQLGYGFYLGMTIIILAQASQTLFIFKKNK